MEFYGLLRTVHLNGSCAARIGRRAPIVRGIAGLLESSQLPGPENLDSHEVMIPQAHKFAVMQNGLIIVQVRYRRWCSSWTCDSDDVGSECERVNSSCESDMTTLREFVRKVGAETFPVNPQMCIRAETTSRIRIYDVSVLLNPTTISI